MTRYLTPLGSARSWPFNGTNSDMEQMLSSLFDDSLTRGNNVHKPAIDVAEDEKSFHVTAELPGVANDDIDVDLANNVLTIRAEKKDVREKSGKNYHRVERSFGSFYRQLALPSEVNADKAEVTFKQGILNIELPKAASEKVKKLTVKS